MDLEKTKENLLRTINEKKDESGQFAPIVSGAAAIFLFSQIIFSNLPFDRFVTANIALLIVFIVSAFLFWQLKKIEQDKDKYLISTVGGIVQDVFRHYGQKLAEQNADMANAKDMNTIMQTIVNLVNELKDLIKKTYSQN